MGKTLRSQKMEARLRHASEDNCSYSVRESCESASEASYSVYGDSTGGRGKIYEPDTSTFGVGGALPGRTQRILEKQKKLEGLLEHRTRHRVEEETCGLSTIIDSPEEEGHTEREGDSSDTTDSCTSSERREGGGASPVVYYVVAPGGTHLPMGAGAFPQGFQFPPGFDPNILSLTGGGAGSGETAVGLDGRALSEEALATLEAQRAAAMQQYMHTQQPQGGGGLPTGINAQTLSMAQQLAALTATPTPGSTPDVSAATGDPLGIDLPTLLLAKRLSALNEQLKSVEGDGTGAMDPNGLLLLLAQMIGGTPPPPPPPPPPIATTSPFPDMSAVHDTLSQMKDLMLTMQQMHMQQASAPPTPLPIPVQDLPCHPQSPPVTAPPAAPKARVQASVPAQLPEPYRKTHRELAPVLYRLVPHRSKFKRANELFETDVDVHYCSDGDAGSAGSAGSAKSGGTGASADSGRESLCSKISDKRRDREHKSRHREKDRPPRRSRKEEAAFSLESFAPPRNGGVGGDERFTVAPRPDDVQAHRNVKSNGRDEHTRSSHFNFDNPLLCPPPSVDMSPRKSQDDFWLDPSADEHNAAMKSRRSSKDDLEIERKSSLLSLTASSLYKKRVHLKPGGHRRDHMRDSCGSNSSHYA